MISMRKGKDSLTFWLTVCVLVVCVAIAKDNGSSEAKGSTEVVYPDYYAKTSTDATTADEESDKATDEVETDEETATIIDDSFVPLADAIPDTDNDTAATAVSQSSAKTKKHSAATTASTATASAQEASSIAGRLLERKSRLLSDMAQSSAVADGVQTLANAVITAKTVKYQTLANVAAVSAVNLHNRHRAEVLSLLSAQQKARTDRVNRVITAVGDTTEDILDTALTIQKDKYQFREDIKNTLEDISKSHDELQDKLDELTHLPQLAD